MPAAATSSRPYAGAWRWALAATLALTALRLAAVFSSPLELYPDEAQYWLWSRTLDFGYFSKPPMIAWLIWLTTRLGDAEPFVRLSSTLLNAATPLVLFGVARRLYGDKAGLGAALLFALMPGVQLAAGIVSTDSPLLFFLSLALLAYVALPDARRPVLVAAGMGAALGAAFLAKYAALYFLIGVALHLGFSREARRVWRWRPTLAGLGAFALVAAPNVIWNALHGFSTVEHTASNANWGAARLFNPAELAEFLVAQFGVFGPLPFAVLVGGGIVLAARRKLQAPDVLLLCFVLPPLAAVTAEAFISRANANWAAAAYVPGSVLVAGWMLRWNARRWLAAGLAIQALAAALFLVWVTRPAIAEAMGAANAFKRAKGWSAAADALVQRAKAEGGAAGLSAVATDDRFLYQAAAYYGRDYFGRPGAPPLVMWLRFAKPENQAEASAPLTPALGRRVLAASLDGKYRAPMAADFTRATGVEIASVRLDKKRTRRTESFIGEGFAPKPR